MQPAAARANVIGLSLLTAEEIARRAGETGVGVLRLDGSQTVADVVAAVEERFGEPLAAGPRAETPEERRSLLRSANDAVASQALAYLARPWASGDPETFVREFVCECDDAECDAVVELPAAEFLRVAAQESERVLAPHPDPLG